MNDLLLLFLSVRTLFIFVFVNNQIIHLFIYSLMILIKILLLLILRFLLHAIDDRIFETWYSSRKYKQKSWKLCWSYLWLRHLYSYVKEKHIWLSFNDWNSIELYDKNKQKKATTKGEKLTKKFKKCSKRKTNKQIR